jgi:hypothetical protein
MTGSEVAAAPASAVPALRHSGANTLEASDLALPRLYVAQAIHNAVQDGLVKIGSLFVANDADDPDPAVLAEPGDKEGVIIHPLALKKGKSRDTRGRQAAGITDYSGPDLERWSYEDGPPANKATGVWVSYTYALAIPSFDTDLPVRWIVSRSGQPAARKINTEVYRLSDDASPATLAFRLTTAERSNDSGRYIIPQVSAVTPDEDDLATALRLAASLGDSFADEASASSTTASANEPGI